MKTALISGLIAGAIAFGGDKLFPSKVKVADGGKDAPGGIGDNIKGGPEVSSAPQSKLGSNTSRTTTSKATEKAAMQQSQQAASDVGTGILNGNYDIKPDAFFDMIKESGVSSLQHLKSAEQWGYQLLAEKTASSVSMGKFILEEVYKQQALNTATRNLAQFAAQVGRGIEVASYLAGGAGAARWLTQNGIKGIFKRQIVRETFCFIAGTQIHTKDGLKNIEDIKVGDLVLSKNEKTGKTSYKQVKQLFKNKDKQILNLIIIKQDGTKEKIGTTPEHPFWVENTGWTDAKDLKTNDKLISANGNPIKVLSIELDDKRQDTYNFEVVDFHTYYVGDDGIWVHNMCLPQINKVTFAKLPHAIGKGVERGVFTNPQTAKNTLKELGKTIKNKGFPEGSFWDPSKIDRILVPTGNKGLAVFSVFENGSAKIRTVLNAR